jgi:hypothetical protein
MPSPANARRKRSSTVIPISRERALMDLARSNAERDHDKPRRPVWVTVVGVLIAVVMVAVAGRGFDAFLGGFQRLLERVAREEAELEARKPQRIFVVPEQQPAAQPGTVNQPEALDPQRTGDARPLDEPGNDVAQPTDPQPSGSQPPGQ